MDASSLVKALWSDTSGQRKNACYKEPRLNSRRSDMGKLQNNLLLKGILEMTSIFEPIAAGVAVALINKYIISKFDFFGSCYTAFCIEEENDCTSYLSTSVVSDAGHLHHF